MKKFADLDFKPAVHGLGVQACEEFPNGYGVSVVQSKYTYGGDRGLYEMAVTLDGKLCYDTPVTNDVLGFLSKAAVTKHLREVQELPPVAAPKKAKRKTKAVHK